MIIEKYYFVCTKPKYKIAFTRYKGNHIKHFGLFIHFGKYLIAIFL